MLTPSPTTRLLVCCIQLNPTAKIRAEIDLLLRQPIDWRAFEDAALWHGVAPLAFNGLRPILDRNRLPGRLFETLKAEYRQNLIRNTIIFAQLEVITDALVAQSVPVLLLKGAAITRMIYKDVGLRPMSDLDILIKKKDLRRAIRAIEACGYRRHDREDLEQLLDTKYHIVYLHPDTNVLLEIHWDITSHHNPALVRPAAHNPMEVWWSRASNTVSGADHVYHLDPIDSICLIASHFFKHRFLKPDAGFSTYGGMLQLCDILNVVCFYQAEVSGEALTAEARRMGLVKTVNVALSVVKILFADAIDQPIAIFDNLNLDSAETVIARHVVDRICAMPDRRASVPIGFIRVDRDASFWGRITTIFKAVFPDPDTLSKRLNRPVDSKRIYVDYIHRIFLLFKKYGILGLKRRHLKEEANLRRWIDELD